MKLESLVTTDQLRSGEYVPEPCTHRPSSHESRQCPQPPTQPSRREASTASSAAISINILPKLLRVSGGCLGLRRRRRTWGSCDKPRGAANQALIRGSPNGATHRGSYLDTLI